MSVDINLHDVKEIRLEKKASFKGNDISKNNQEYTFYTRHIVFIQEDGTETDVCVFSQTSDDLNPINEEGK